MENHSKKIKTIFHYTSFGSAQKIIETKSLKSTNPKNLNDPFECSPHVKSRDDYIKDDTWDSLIDQNIENRTLFYKTGYDEWCKLGKKGPLKDFLKSADPSRMRFQETIGLRTRFISFSKVGNSIPMWAHYGKNHTGVVFEFSTSKMPFAELPEPICFTEVDYPKSGNRVLWPHLEIELLTEEEKLEHMYKIYRRKDPAWSYEKEVRLILPTTITDHPETSTFAYKDNIGEIFLRFSPESLKAIYTGMKMNMENQKTVNHLVNIHFQNIKPVNVKMSKDTFDFVPFSQG